MPQPNQKVERECSFCGKIRGIYEFSASQRRKGDDAACLRCIPEIQNVKPGHLKHTEDDSDAKYIAHTGSTANNTTTGSYYNKTGGVRLATSVTSTAMTVGSGNGSITSTGSTTRTGTGTYNGPASSSVAPSRFSSTSNNTEAPPTYILRDNGWITVPNQFREEPVPELADDDVETFREDDDQDDWDM
ncbi:hypothetical protein E4T44_09029 [Aureobasidium sp. EXF-8845]|nr:hypothetical protein E4T44_09029 [Aureobasidium sp. EXF-8845]KAI4855351.1 hypothetical protein E4T45_03215 [Aureobasidium sp. EXF-8846]